jgi:hypothetical protein
MSNVQQLDPRTLETIHRATAAARSGALAQACAVGEQGLRDGAEEGAINAMLGVFRCRMGDFTTGTEHVRVAQRL